MNYSPKNPFSGLKYLPELDTYEECYDNHTIYLQNLVGIFQWIIEIGRIYITLEVSSLLKLLALPYTAHLRKDLHIFKYVDIHQCNDLNFDPRYHHV